MKIRNIAICKIIHNDKIFVLEGFDPAKNETFYRPVGGGIEFGELAREAAIREFREELNTELSIGSGVEVFENIFEFNGTAGHEIVFILEASFLDDTFYEHNEFTGNENGSPFKALWVPLEDFKQGNRTLYPEGFVNSL